MKTYLALGRVKKMRLINLLKHINLRKSGENSAQATNNHTDNTSEHSITTAGLLSKQEITKYSLIHDCEDKCLQAGSYDLRVGDRHFVFEDSGRWRAIFLGEANELAQANDQLPSDPSLILQLPRQGYNDLVIPPFGSAIIQLKETVDLYTVAETENLMIAGRFDLKLKAIYKGLISQQATQVEPCYKGKLYCFVHNLGSQAVKLQKNDKIATIEFSYVGQNLSKEDREKIIKDTIRANQEKYKSDKFTFKGTGIKDVRWLKSERLPEECGIAPIYNLVHGNIGEEVDKQLEKTSTIDKLAARVENRLSEKQNVFKIVLSLVVAVITFFTANFLMEVNAELKYFSQELSFLIERDSELEASALEAIRGHTQELSDVRNTMWKVSIVLLMVIVVLMFRLLRSYMRPNKEQKWERKRKALQAKHRYISYKEEYSNNKKNIKKSKNPIEWLKEQINKFIHCI